MNPPDGNRVTVAGPFAVDTWTSRISGAVKPEMNMGSSPTCSFVPLAISTGSEPCESRDGTGTHDLVPLARKSVGRPLRRTVWHVPFASGFSSTFQVTPSNVPSGRPGAVVDVVLGREVVLVLVLLVSAARGLSPPSPPHAATTTVSTRTAPR